MTHHPIRGDGAPIDDRALSRREVLARLEFGAVGAALLGALPSVSLAAPARVIVRASDAPLAFRTVGIGRPHEARLVPFFAVAHEWYTIYWKTVPDGAAPG